MKWSQTKLEFIACDKPYSFVGGPFGSNLTSHDYVNEGVPVIRGSNLNNGRFLDLSDFVYVSESKVYKDLYSNLAKPKDLIFTQRGTLGQVSVIPIDGGYDRYVVSQSQMKLTVNEEKADNLFIYYYFSSREAVKKILRFVSSSGVPHINLTVLRNFEVPIPPLHTQKRIVSILSPYDDLIETNRRRIQLLEEAARLLYREWFVYFRFPGHKNVKMVDVDGMNIPMEWKYIPFVKLNIFKKAPLGVPVFIDTRQYYQTSEISGTSITGIGKEVDFENRPSRANIAPRINTVYFAKMKDTLKVLYFNKGNSDLLDRVLLSTGMVGFTTAEKHLGYLFCILTSHEFIQYKNNFATGATQVSLNDASLKKIKVIYPTISLIEKFSKFVNPLLEECSYLKSQNQKLTQARDLLLPRLMSGAIEV